MSVPASGKVVHMQPQRTLQIDEACRLVGADVASVTALSGASGSGVFDVETAAGDALIVKLFPSEYAWKLEKELAVRRLLDEHALDLPVPRVVAEHTEDLALVLERLTGEPAGAVEGDEVRQLYREMGRLLAELHTIELDAFGYFTANGIYEPRANNLDYMRFQYEARLSTFFELGGDPELGHAVQAHLRERDELFVGPAAPVLCHNDHHEGNIVVSLDDGVTITGWFDFENALAADPLLDLAKSVVYSPRDRAAVTEALAQGYGDLPSDWRNALELYELFHVLELWVWLAGLDDDTLLEQLARSMAERVG